MLHTYHTWFNTTAICHVYYIHKKIFCKQKVSEHQVLFLEPIFCRGQALDGSWVVTQKSQTVLSNLVVSMPSRAWVVTRPDRPRFSSGNVSMPSRAWVVTLVQTLTTTLLTRLNALTGLSCYANDGVTVIKAKIVSMPSRAYTSLFLLGKWHVIDEKEYKVCQCPLELIPHFYSWISHRYH